MINLTFNRAFDWTTKKNIWVKGVVFDKKNNCLQNETLIEYFSYVTNELEFKNTLKQLNGFFSVVIKTNDCIFAAVDYTRSHPLFYSKEHQWIGDDPKSLTKTKHIEKDPVSVLELSATGYVTGSDTTYKDIKQVQAGEYLVFKDSKIKTKSYYKYLHTDFINYNQENALDALDKSITNAIKRLVTYANGRQLVLPLSGGFDSRLIALKVKELDYKNILCFSYGKKNNWESQVSEKVATKLGFNWTFIDYKPIIKSLYQSTDMIKYSHFAHRTVSFPHIQDYFAVHQLKERTLIENNAIFIPGHSADFLAGSHLSNLELHNSSLTQAQITKRILNNHYVLFKLTKKQKDIYSQKIIATLPSQAKSGDTSSQLDHWNWRERQAKFIVNACRVYEFFGYQWHCPLWDTEIMEYFQKLPLKYRKEKWLYNYYVDQLEPKLAQKEPEKKSYLRTYLSTTINTMFDDSIYFHILKLYRDQKNRLCFNKLIPLHLKKLYYKKGYKNTNGVLIAHVIENFLKEYG
ncbi:MAG: hypothetical protein CMP21_00900 [Rickettsiales bacterium]|nr:hypothetical protein [Rickettsiales bacterium]|tara:strand:- start:7153 stop:8706 length:1554 start_codon:yes stop_codon:yes gene_type:complete